MQAGKTFAVRKQCIVCAAQLNLHVGVDHAWGQRADFGPPGFERLVQRQAAGEMVHAGFGRAVGRLRSHGPAAQTR